MTSVQASDALGLLRQLAVIPAPSHHEERRATFVRDWLRAAGATHMEIDDVKNVVCQLGPADVDRFVVFSAHTDVVFPDTDPLPLHEDAEKIYAPGVGDDTANLCALLLATRELIAHPEALPRSCGVLVVANSCEEGLGNLDGTKALYRRYAGQIVEHVAFDLYLPQCISCAVGSHRYRITCHTQGGHSLRDYGRPNAIEVLCNLVEDLYGNGRPWGAEPFPDDEGATQNVGVISGGTSVNAIPAEASMLYEYRSESEGMLQDLGARLRGAIQRHSHFEGTLGLQCIGERPGNGRVDPVALEALASRAGEVITRVTGQQPDRSPASTDVNVPLSLGIPAVCVGAVRGGLLHTREEWVEKASLADGCRVARDIMFGELARL